MLCLDGCNVVQFCAAPKHVSASTLSPALPLSWPGWLLPLAGMDSKGVIVMSWTYKNSDNNVKNKNKNKNKNNGAVNRLRIGKQNYKNDIKQNALISCCLRGQQCVDSIARNAQPWVETLNILQQMQEDSKKPEAINDTFAKVKTEMGCVVNSTEVSSFYNFQL